MTSLLASIIDWEEEAKEEEEVVDFMDKWASEMLPRLQHLQCGIQSGNLPLGTLLGVQKEIFEGMALFFCGLPQRDKHVMIERIAPGWAELITLMEKNRLLAQKLAKRSAARG